MYKHTYSDITRILTLLFLSLPSSISIYLSISINQSIYLSISISVLLILAHLFTGHVSSILGIVVSQITTTLPQQADATLTSIDTTSEEPNDFTQIPAEEEKDIPQLRDAATGTEDEKEEEEEEEEEDEEEIVVLERESIETEEQTSEKQEEEEKEEEAEILDAEEDEEGWVVL